MLGIVVAVAATCLSCSQPVVAASAKRTENVVQAATTVWIPQDVYQGASFFECVYMTSLMSILMRRRSEWDFFTDKDPTKCALGL